MDLVLSHIARVLLFSSLFLNLVQSWPDGAPCLHNVYESMNPLEAPEHQGGLMLTLPPYYIELDRQCYRRGDFVQLELRGNHTKDKFKGFQIQPLIYNGPSKGRRLGHFERLDDNGSWQQQCFRTKDSVTHSHNVNKRSIILWWRNDGDDTQTVQFVATVVVHQRQFWVKSVLSNPLPPCKVSRLTPNWRRDPITPPPPPNQFKMETNRIFSQPSPFVGQRMIESSAVANLPRQPPPPFRQAVPQQQMPFQQQPFHPQQQTFMQQPFHLQQQPFVTQAPQFQFQQPHQFAVTVPPQHFTPAFQQFTPAPFVQHPVAPQAHPMPTQPPHERQRLTHIIPVPNMIPNRRIPTATHLPLEAERDRQMRMLQQASNQFPPNACIDIENQRNCFTWIAHCSTSAFMRVFCKRTCRLC